MGAWHPDRKALERFLGDELTTAESRELERHLFACGACERLLIQLLPPPSVSSAPAGNRRAATPAQEHGVVLREQLQSTREQAHRHRARSARERHEAQAMWQELRGLAPAARQGRLAAEPRFHTWGLFELLLETALEEALAEPQRAEELLRLALALTDELDADRYGHGAVEAAKTRAWAYLGNSLRILSDFRQAEHAFEMAERCFEESWLDPLDEALLLELEGSLRRAQRRFEESVRLLETAVRLYREVNEPHLHGRALMKQGLVLQYKGDFAAATDCFRESVTLLDGSREPRLVVISQFNLINCLFDSGNTHEAAALIPAARGLMEQAGTPSDLLHLRWLEAEVAAALGRTAEAEQAFLEVKNAFSAAHAAFDAALVALELAALYAREGRGAEVEPLAAEIIPIFRSCQVPQEALAAVIVLQKAAEAEQITLGLVEEVSTFIERVRTNPNLRFRGEGERVLYGS